MSTVDRMQRHEEALRSKEWLATAALQRTYHNCRAYWRQERWLLLVALAGFVAVVASPPFQLFAVSSPKALLTHSLLECFAIFVSLLIVVVSWQSFTISKVWASGMLVAGYLSVAAIDVAHTLSYEGMPDFISDNSTSKAIFFWLTSRTIATLTLFLIAARVHVKLDRRVWLVVAASIAASIIWLGVFQLHWFPETYVAGVGVTAFKSAYEYALFGADVLVGLTFICNAQPGYARRAYAGATASFILAMCAIVFAHYRTTSDFANIIGHVFKVAAYYILYRVMFVAAVRQPYERAISAEAELARMNATLEDAIKQRTEELARSNRELNEFASIVSHDLHAPVRHIAGYARLLERECGGQLDDAGRSYVNSIVAACANMHELIAGLLTLARQERETLALVEVNLSELAERCAAELRAEDPTRQTQFAIAADLHALADSALIKDVLENLLGNAWKFTAKRVDGRIEFGVAEARKGAAFFVRDNGVGFEPERTPRLFQAFQRLHSQQEFRGTGLGLASTKRIVERHGGEIWAEGAPGQGAVFYFTLAPGRSQERRHASAEARGVE